VKQPAKPTTTEERPKALDVLVGVTEIALAYRYPEKTLLLQCHCNRVVAQTAGVVLRGFAGALFPSGKLGNDDDD
jgi:hypothetical protein